MSVRIPAPETLDLRGRLRWRQLHDDLRGLGHEFNDLAGFQQAYLRSIRVTFTPTNRETLFNTHFANLAGNVPGEAYNAALPRHRFEPGTVAPTAVVDPTRFPPFPPGITSPEQQQAWRDMITMLRAGGYDISATTPLDRIQRDYLTSLYGNDETRRTEIAGLSGNQLTNLFNSRFNLFIADRGAIHTGTPPALVAPRYRANGTEIYTAITGSIPESFRRGANDNERRTEWLQLVTRLRAAGYNNLTDVASVQRAFIRSRTGADPAPGGDLTAEFDGHYGDGADRGRVQRRADGTPNTAGVGNLPVRTAGTDTDRPDGPGPRRPRRRRRRRGRRRRQRAQGPGRQGPGRGERQPYTGMADERDHQDERMTRQRAEDIQTLLTAAPSDPRRQEALARLGIADGNLASLATQLGLNTQAGVDALNQALGGNVFRLDGDTLHVGGRSINLGGSTHSSGPYTGRLAWANAAFGNTA